MHETKAVGLNCVLCLPGVGVDAWDCVTLLLATDNAIVSHAACLLKHLLLELQH